MRSAFAALCLTVMAPCVAMGQHVAPQDTIVDEPVPQLLTEIGPGITLDAFERKARSANFRAITRDMEVLDAETREVLGVRLRAEFKIDDSRFYGYTAKIDDADVAEHLPVYLVDYEDDFRSAGIDLDLLLEQAASQLGEEPACRDEEDRYVEFHFDENWNPTTGDCTMTTLAYGRPLDQDVRDAMLGGYGWRYTVGVGIYLTREAIRDQFLTLIVQDNEMRAAVESVVLEENSPRGQEIYDEMIETARAAAGVSN